MSRRLVIVVDCDDVLIHTTKYLVDTYNDQYGTQVPLAHAYDSGYDAWAAEKPVVLQRFVEMQMAPAHAEILPRADAIEAVKTLAQQHELHLVTARLADVDHVTRAMVDEYFPECFASINHVGVDYSKGAVCKDLGADVIIDDNFKHVVAGREHGVGLPIWFGQYPWQREHDVQEINGVRCSEWGEVVREVTRFARG